MRHKNRGDAHFLLQFPNFNTHFQPQLCIKVRKRLVQQKQLRPHYKRPCKGDALPLPAGKLTRIAFAEF